MDVLAKSEELASRAVALDPSDAQALAILGHVRAFLHHRVAEAVTLYERALALNPNLPMAWVFSALALSYRGEHEEALRRWERYKRLAPLHPHAFFFDSARLVPLLMTKRHEEVDAAARQVTALHTGFTFPYKAWLSALGHLGRREEAAQVRDRLLAMEPDFDLAKARERIAAAPARGPRPLPRRPAQGRAGIVPVRPGGCCPPAGSSRPSRSGSSARCDGSAA